MWTLLQRLYRSPTLVLAITALLVLSLLNAGLMFWPQQAQLKTFWTAQGEQLATEYAHRATNLLTLDDRISLTVEVQRWARQASVTGVEVINTQGRTITEAGATPGPAVTAFSAPLYYEDQLLGTLSLWQDESALATAQQRGMILLTLTLVVIAGLGYFLWRRFVGQQHRTQHALNQRLQTHFPELDPDPNAEPAVQAQQLMQQLERHYHSSLQVVSAMHKRLPEHQLAEIHEHYLASDQPGAILDGALIKIDLLNLDALDDQLTPDAIKRLLDSTQQRCEDVMRLYHGETTQDPWLFLVRDHSDEGDFMQRTLCVAWVLSQLLLDAKAWEVRPQPLFSVSVMAGPLYAGVQIGSGLPVLTVFGQTLKQLEVLSSHNKSAQILLGERVFQYAALANVIDAEIYRDITLPDSETLEVWRLNGFSENWARVLERQLISLQARA